MRALLCGAGRVRFQPVEVERALLPGPEDPLAPHHQLHILIWERASSSESFHTWQVGGEGSCFPR